MKPLEYFAPTTLQAALELASQAGVQFLCGGTDLIIQHRAGRVEVERMVDLKKIPALNVLEYDANKGLRLGAAVSCQRFTDDAAAIRYYPALVEGAELIGSVQIQTRASIGGNVCNGSPAGDTIASLMVLNAHCLIAGPHGTREVHAKDFITAPGKTALQKGEVLVEFVIPPVPSNTSSAYLRFIPRNEMDIAVADVAVSLTLEDDKKTVREAKVALGAVAPTVLMVDKAVEALAGSTLDETALSKGAKACTEAAQPIDDARGTVAYRKHMAGVLFRRATMLALGRVQNPNYSLSPV